jgi:hypothetical protein
MSILGQCREVSQKLVFGDTLLPQAFTIGLAQPQQEIAVWVHGMGAPIDVTNHHSMACADPFTVCIAFDEERKPSQAQINRLSLKFCERAGQRRTLGEIELTSRETTVIPTPGSQLILFQARSSSNHCLPKARIGAHYLLHRYSLWKKLDSAGIKMSFLDRRAVMVMFIRPHPVVLASIDTERGGNIFPMNIMGELRDGYFAFALKNSRLAAHLVERAGRIALSDVPLTETSLTYRLGVNHGKPSVEWDNLPFATRTSKKLNLRVPVFSSRIREMEIREIHNLGSHKFFIASIVHEERTAESVGLCIVHGFYQACRLKERPEDLKVSVKADMFNKRGTPHSSLPL